MTATLDPRHDVVVIGGGAAGLSGALTLARARWRTLVVDAGEPRNAPAGAVHGLLGREGVSPADLLATGRREVQAVGGEIVAGRVVGAVRDDDPTHPFHLTLADGRTTRARRLLVATGLVDELPAVPGLAERWGRDVLHCPFCHGYEVRDRRVGVLATGPHAVRQALLFRQWTAHVTLLAHTAGDVAPDDAARLAHRGVAVVPGTVARLDVVDDALHAAVLDDGTSVPLDAVVVATTSRVRTAGLEGLGLEVAPHPSGAGEHLVADPHGATTVPGVRVAGNATNLAAQVGQAAAEGAWAAAQLTMELIEEDSTVPADA
ncbi:thioredoxin reductase [Isoptericola jiangsuensis]|uniref:Thioredoxin reductase n=1 Tax=Isoptericola jiangsuensis TaxID=548579 RepID=A0A2A9EUJ1_9MICO|nr:NAD(P)/FAD-dependent oxidoreductase [Isoptericola jiangsuensis]PFG42694.1 thioredoxin reductase [Isoptericola jiangsuensis]